MEENVKQALICLRNARCSPFDLLLMVLDENRDEFQPYRSRFYMESSQKMENILDAFHKTYRGRRKLRAWLQSPRGLDIMRDIVTEEMDAVQKSEHLSGVSAITPEFIRTWSVSDNSSQAPYLTQVLLTAAQTPAAKEKNKKKKPEAVGDLGSSKFWP
jgi:hypothetical protein